MKKVQDHYYHKAKKEKFVARSIYKLQEVNEKTPMLRKKDHVLDLGCFPGSWLQYIAQVVGPEGLVVGVDLQELKIQTPDNVHFIHGDINELDLSFPGEYASQFHVVVSDMAPKTSGIKSVDADRSYQLCQMALLVAQKWLKPGGNVLVKSFQGSPFSRLLQQMREEYSKVKIIKPKSSRNESVEIFVLGMGKQR